MLRDFADRSDRDLFSDAGLGDEAALGEIFDRHRDRVFRHVCRSSDSIEEAHDITAVVFLEAWRKRRSARFVDGSILPWLLVTATNVSRNQNRTRRRYRALLARLPLPEPHPDHALQALERAAALERRTDVKAAFQRLSPLDQEILTLCVLEELSVREAATALGVPPGTIKSRLSRAKGHLAARLQHLDPFESSGRAL